MSNLASFKFLMLRFSHYEHYNAHVSALPNLLEWLIHVPIVTSFQEYFIHIRNVHVNNSILFTLSMLSFSHFWVFCISVQCKDWRKVEWLGDKWNKTEEKIIPIIFHQQKLRLCIPTILLLHDFPLCFVWLSKAILFTFLTLPVSCSQSVLFSFLTISPSFQIKCWAVWLYG